MVFIMGLFGIFVTPLLFEPLAEIIQNYGPAKAQASVWWTYHIVFWIFAFTWAVFFGIWIFRADGSWFSSGDLKRKFRLILALAIVIRLSIVLLINIPPASDAKAYDMLAQNLAQTGNFQDGGSPTAFRPIGYVAFLAGLYRLFGHNVFLPKLANLLFDFFSLILLWKLFTCWKDASMALKVVAITAFFIPEIYSTQYLLSEQLFVFLWLLSIYCWEVNSAKNYLSLISGAVFGLAALVRPVVLAWMVLLVLAGLTKKRWLGVIGFILAVLVVTGPWLYRNNQKLGIWGLSAHAGINFWMGANPEATGYYHMPDSLPLNTSSQRDLDRVAWKLGWEFVKSHPWQYLRLGLTKEAVTFGFEHNFVFDLYEPPTHGQLIWGILGQAYWWILLFFAVVSGAKTLTTRQGREKIGSWLPFWTLLYWAAVHFFFVGATRYHHPVVPFFAYFAAFGFSALPKNENPNGSLFEPLSH